MLFSVLVKTWKQHNKKHSFSTLLFHSSTGQPIHAHTTPQTKTHMRLALRTTRGAVRLVRHLGATAAPVSG
jgi:hypothetical protein